MNNVHPYHTCQLCNSGRGSSNNFAHFCLGTNRKGFPRYPKEDILINSVVQPFFYQKLQNHDIRKQAAAPSSSGGVSRFQCNNAVSGLGSTGPSQSIPTLRNCWWWQLESSAIFHLPNNGQLSSEYPNHGPLYRTRGFLRSTPSLVWGKLPTH